MNQSRSLSPREIEIVELCGEGLTNDGIAHRLGLSVGTVNTYWLRIKLKVGGVGRTETVLRIFQERADHILNEALADWDGLSAILEKRGMLDIVAEKERDLEQRTTLALLHLAMDKMKATVWATDAGLYIHVLANGELASNRFGVQWEEGKTIFELFNTTDEAHPAVAAHIHALAGSASEQRLSGEFANMLLKVVPLPDEFGDILSCISILTSVSA